MFYTFLRPSSAGMPAFASNWDVTSVEQKDGVASDEYWALSSGRRPFEEEEPSPTWSAQWSRQRLIKRLEEFEQNELKTFVAQKLFKLDSVACDEQTRLVLIEKALMNTALMGDEEEEAAEMQRKYGFELAEWLTDRLSPALSDTRIVHKVADEFTRLRLLDPLFDWPRQPVGASSAVLTRINKLANEIASKVHWSALIHPGAISCHLMELVSDFSRLDQLMCRSELTRAESAHSAFAANHIHKARSKYITCLDATRVVLRDLGHSVRVEDDDLPEWSARATAGGDAGDSELAIEMDDSLYPSLQLQEVFDPSVLAEMDKHQKQTHNHKYGTDDFIHASWVRGGPLLNRFILAQAPLPNTIQHFWHMVYQERVGHIFMLCAAVETPSLGRLDGEMPDHCPYYWPREEGGRVRFGEWTIRNMKVDGTSDPLFTVTHLDVCRDGCQQVVSVEHWQWDWTNFSDTHWPIRLLRRSRLSARPTVVQCLDGCGKSGTLVAIEAALMSLLRGAPIADDVMSLSALFVRMQRKHAIATPVQYLFCVRVVVHWLSPFVSSWWTRARLGLSSIPTGFIHKYEQIVREQARIRPRF